jgi:hypothetical protein
MNKIKFQISSYLKKKHMKLHKSLLTYNNFFILNIILLVIY